MRVFVTVATVGSFAGAARRLRLSPSVVTRASPGYRDRRGTPRSAAQLAAHDVIAFDPADTTNEWRFAASTVRVRPRLTVDSADAAIAAAVAGVGVTRALSYQVDAAIRAGQL